jgi:hypothetical protein
MLLVDTGAAPPEAEEIPIVMLSINPIEANVAICVLGAI